MAPPAPTSSAGPRTEIVGRSDIVGVYAGVFAGLTAVDAATPPPVGDLDLPPAPLSPAARYAVHEEIARGGMGVLYRATDTLLGREVVLKLLRDELVGRRAAERRFLREARINGQLQHPAVVPVYDVGRFPDGRPYLTMRYVPGRTLDDLLAARPGPAAGRPYFLWVVTRVCEAVAYAHARGVVHRDLKPANVIVPPAGPIRVLDWGLGKVLTGRRAAPGGRTVPDIDPAGLTARAGPPGPGETAHGAAVGTPAYMPPEQAGGVSSGVDERADVFGLGGLLAVVLTGAPPYAGADSDAVRAMARAGDLAPAHARLAGCGAGPALIDLATRCLAADPAARPRDAGEVGSALAAILTEPDPGGRGGSRAVRGLAAWIHSRFR